MSWMLAADWLAAVGLLFLTFGTVVQAVANLTEFKALRNTVSKATLEAMRGRSGFLTEAAVTIYAPRRLTRWLWASVLFLTALVAVPGALTQIRAEGGDKAVELARFLRLAAVWTILMIGSALALADAVIQLALAY